MSQNESDEVTEVVEENESLFQRLAASDLPISKDAERALELLNATQESESE